MSEDPVPYSSTTEARGAEQVTAETQLLADAFAYGRQREVSQAVQQQYQALIPELLARQAERQRSGQTYLPPLRTRVVGPATTPAWTPPPEQEPSPIQVHIDPTVLAGSSATGPGEPELDPGRAQVVEEQALLDGWLKTGMSPRYQTPAEQQEAEKAVKALIARKLYREQTGKDYIPW